MQSTIYSFYSNSYITNVHINLIYFEYVTLQKLPSCVPHPFTCNLTISN